MSGHRTDTRLRLPNNCLPRRRSLRTTLRCAHQNIAITAISTYLQDGLHNRVKRPGLYGVEQKDGLAVLSCWDGGHAPCRLERSDGGPVVEPRRVSDPPCLLGLYGGGLRRAACRSLDMYEVTRGVEDVDVLPDVRDLATNGDLRHVRVRTKTAGRGNAVGDGAGGYEGEDECANEGSKAEGHGSGAHRLFLIRVNYKEYLNSVKGLTSDWDCCARRVKLTLLCIDSTSPFIQRRPRRDEQKEPETTSMMTSMITCGAPRMHSRELIRAVTSCHLTSCACLLSLKQFRSPPQKPVLCNWIRWFLCLLRSRWAST
jgi:hypothetical protein